MNILEDQFLVGLLPGSRDSELKYNFEAQVRAAALIAKQRPQTRFLILVAPTIEIEKVRSLIPPDLETNIRLVKDEPFKILQLCDACIVASGTATLVTGLSETPMVIMYKMNRLTGFVARRLVSGEHFGMANLILGERAVPELFQEQANPENMAREVLKFIDDPGYRASVKAKLAMIKDRLGRSGAVNRVVDELAKIIENGRGAGRMFEDAGSPAPAREPAR
jgi:lipid-A-disaccharide synthase